MKNLKITLLMSLAIVLGLSACISKTSDDLSEDLQRQLDDNKKKTDDMMNYLKASVEQGGQPGSIKVSGIIVNDNAETDVRIRVFFRGGIGKNGRQSKVADSNKPVLTSKNEKLDLSKMGEQKNLISLGCDNKTVSKFASERSLEVEGVPAPISKGVLVISAKTIVLCGKNNKINTNSLTGQFITFNADELILDHFDYTLIGVIGSLSFNANKLLLQGSNQIATKGIDSSMTSPVTPSLEFNVLKEISSSDDGKVLLMSSGSDYKADAK